MGFRASLLVALAFASSALATTPNPRPNPMLLHSAYTPWTLDGALNVTKYSTMAQAAQAKAMGVNTVFVCGSMAEFDKMTIDERKTLAEAWLEWGTAEGLYIIVNVGTTVLAEAKELAAHALEHGAAAIASVPPYYNAAPDIPTLVSWLKDMASAAPTLPFFYYHLPGVTQVNIPIATFMAEAESQGFSQLMAGGVKYVGSDYNDFLNTANWVAASQYSADPPLVLFAPEPKLQGFALQSPYAGAVLAEDFYAPT